MPHGSGGYGDAFIVHDDDTVTNGPDLTDLIAVGDHPDPLPPRRRITGLPGSVYALHARQAAVGRP
ncbi:hypothetical protein [Streptomyces sp. 11-1-2]|uniref:hypothetical protein n=1 Tax=unclassified Streptomyces TaxID=2593676 RepID=UPI0013C515A8|nr:hypothetical protein [Streptomyces sp. 11-1-2]